MFYLHTVKWLKFYLNKNWTQKSTITSCLRDPLSNRDDGILHIPLIFGSRASRLDGNIEDTRLSRGLTPRPKCSWGILQF